MKNTENPKDCKGKHSLRVNNVVRRMGVSERTVRYWAAKGLINASRQGEKIWVFDPEEVDAFAQQRRENEGVL